MWKFWCIFFYLNANLYAHFMFCIGVYSFHSLSEDDDDDDDDDDNGGFQKTFFSKPLLIELSNQM